MKTQQEKRIELLEKAHECIRKTVNTDREMYDYHIRRENRKTLKVLKEIEKWKEELYEEQRVDNSK